MCIDVLDTSIVSQSPKNSLRKYNLNIGKSLQRFFLKLTNNFKAHQWIWKDYMQVVKELLNWFVGINL